MTTRNTDDLSRDEFRFTSEVTKTWQAGELAAAAQAISAIPKTVAAAKYVETAADRKLFKGIRASLTSDLAQRYVAKLQAQFETHKQMLRYAFTMKSTWSDSGFWQIVDGAWHFAEKRQINHVSDRGAVMQMNRLRQNLQINWTTDLVLTNSQKPTVSSAYAGGYEVWCCLRHDKNGATAIMMFHRGENKYMIVYENGSFTRSTGAPRMSADVWPVTAKITRNTAKVRKMQVAADGSIKINRK